MSIAKMLHKHFKKIPLESIVVTERAFPFRMRADLQRAMDEFLQAEPDIRQFGGVNLDFDHEGIALSQLMIRQKHNEANIAPPQYEEVDVGDEQPVRCLKNGIWTIARNDFRFAALLAPHLRMGQAFGTKVQIAVPGGEEGVRVTQEIFKRLEVAVEQSKSYRGKILSLEQSHMFQGMTTGIRVHRLDSIARDQVILPAGTLDLLDRNVIDFISSRPRLSEMGMSVKKGLLFYGPPGTGKTHTIHYLAGALKEHTTLIITAEQVGLLDEYMQLARLLQPSAIVIEDVDLIARSRTSRQSACDEVLLNKLLNEMDGLKPDAEILFLLTTNRPEDLEAALASRPGRIDQAIEFPLPDDEGRAKLIKLYSFGLDVPPEVAETAVRKTDGVTASFIKELMRRAAQFHLERGDESILTDQDLDAAIQELLFKGGTLNRKLLGGRIESPEA